MKRTTLCLLVAIPLMTACTDNTPDYPVAEKRPVELERHGHVRTDDYFWLNERDNPEVIAYLEAENAYTDRVLEPTVGLRQRLIDEMAARITEDETSAPYRDGEYYYYYRYEAGKDYPIYCRRNPRTTLRPWAGREGRNGVSRVRWRCRRRRQARRSERSGDG